MSPLSLAPAITPDSTTRLRLVSGGRSFISVPVDHTPGESPWLVTAMHELLATHDRVLFLLVTELGDYDGGADLRADHPVLRPAATAERAVEVTMSQWRELEAIRGTLPASETHRVQIASWSHFIDPSFAAVWRHLLTAFGVGIAFRRDVLRLGRKYLKDGRGQGVAAPVARVACLRAIESLAMRLRVAELAGYHHEYGRGRDAVLAARLYAGAYATDGLTVESLIGEAPQRRYHQLG